MQKRFEKFARIFSRRHKQTTFSDAGFLGILRVNWQWKRICWLIYTIWTISSVRYINSQSWQLEFVRQADLLFRYLRMGIRYGQLFLICFVFSKMSKEIYKLKYFRSLLKQLTMLMLCLQSDARSTHVYHHTCRSFPVSGMHVYSFYLYLQYLQNVQFCMKCMYLIPI